MKKMLASVLTFAVLPGSLFAHPGHGETDGYTIIHYFTEPDHAVYTVSALIVGIVLFLKLRSRKAGK